MWVKERFPNTSSERLKVPDLDKSSSTFKLDNIARTFNIDYVYMGLNEGTFGDNSKRVFYTNFK